MHHISTPEGYKPLQFSDAEIAEMYERHKQRREHEFKETFNKALHEYGLFHAPRPFLVNRANFLRAMHHESNLEETQKYLEVIPVPSPHEVLQDMTAVPEIESSRCTGCYFHKKWEHENKSCTLLQTERCSTRRIIFIDRCYND